MGPHDALFKWVFSIADHVAAELRSVLPSDILDRFDLTDLTDVSETFLAPELRETRSDVLYRAPFTGHPALLYFLLEHQSDQDHYMPLRVYDYVRSIWKKWLDQNPKPKTLPLVFPVVFHHGQSPWKAPRSLHKMIDGIDQVPALAKHVPNVHLYIDDIQAQGNKALLSRNLPPALLVASFLFRDSRKKKALRANSRAWLPFLQRVRPDHMRHLVSYIGEVAGLAEVEFLKAQAAKQAPKALRTMTTYAEHLRQEGSHQTLRNMLSVQLTERFGELDEPTKQRIDNASLDQLEQWVRRIIKAPTLEAIFTD